VRQDGLANVCFQNVLQSRFDILKIHSRKMNLMRGIDLKKIAEKMNGASGAELKVKCFLFLYFYLVLSTFCLSLMFLVNTVRLCARRRECLLCVRGEYT